VTVAGRHVTMKDVAQDAQVSQSTVSRILSGAPPAVPISETTRARVLETARRLQYRPNPLARGLRGAPTMLIGAIVRDVTDPFFATAIDVLSRRARHRGYSVVLGHARGEADEALALAAVLEARQCDAIVLLGDIRDQPALLADLATVSGPVIELWQGSGSQGFPAIAVDNDAGMRAAMDHLRTLGHRRIAFGGGARQARGARRLGGGGAAGTAAGAARRAAFEQCGGQDVVTAVNAPQAGGEALDALLDRAEPPTAIAAATDVLAFGILHQAAVRGLRVPVDLSVTGFDDIPLAASAVPALTTVRMPVDAMVRAAIARAIPDGETDPGPQLQRFATELIVRASTGPPRDRR
jgi:DNA-binding LacI/PurR family transcriptional regulator